MIRELNIVREPRGISWQNWAATCKDTLGNNARYLAVVLLVIAAAVGGTLYIKHASTGSLAHHSHTPTSSGNQVNLNTTPTTLPAASDQTTTQTAPAAASTKSAATNTTKAMVVTPVCNVAAEAAAKLQYNTNLTLENTYHTTQLTLLGVTGTVGSLFGNPNVAKITAENTRHQNVINNLQATLSSQLVAAHCAQ